MPTPLTLRVEEGLLQGTTFDSGRLKHITIGRTRTNRFQIKDETISQKHLSVDWVDDAWAAQDLGSSNGTTVNGVSIGVKTPYRIYHDDLLRIGVDTRIRVVLHDGSAPRKLESVKEVDEEEEEQENVAAAAAEPILPAFEKEKEVLEEESVILPPPPPPPSATVASIAKRASIKRTAQRTAKKAFASSIQGTEMTLRDWFRQEMVRIPTILTERAEATIREMEIHAEQLRASFIHLKR